MMNLTTTYLGLSLKHPIVPSASPLSRDLDSIKRLEDAGASAIVMYSLFEEQIEQEQHLTEHYRSYGTETYAEALSYFPDLRHYNAEPDKYVELIRRAKEASDIPIIGSLNGVSSGGWIDYARNIEQAGADAIEINLYYVPTQPDLRADQVEQRYLDVLYHVNQAVTIPIAMKLSPFFSAPANMAKRLAANGAQGLVLFNRFYQPDFDLEVLEVMPHLVLSSSDELHLPLRWVAILFGRVPVDLAITTGVHTHFDVLKGLMAGAKVTMMASELLQNGISRIGAIRAALVEWMEQHEYRSVAQMQGSLSQAHVTHPDTFVRANYMKMLDSWHGPMRRGGSMLTMPFDDDQVFSE